MYGCITDNNGVSQSDVFSNDTYVGRLLIFPTLDPLLIAAGIEQEWFLLATTGKVESGHINASGEWSLSEQRSLHPSLEYASADEILETVAELIFADKNQASDTTPLPADTPILSKRSPNDLDTQWTNFIASMAPLQELIAAEQEQLEAEKKANQASVIEVEIDTLTDSFNQLSVLDTLPEEELNLEEIEETIIEAFRKEYKLQKTTEFLLPPFGVVEVHAEEEYFVLRSYDSGRTIMTATWAGEVIEALNKADATLFNQALKQSEVEVNKLPQSEISPLDVEPMEIQTTDNSNKQKGLSYGD